MPKVILNQAAAERLQQLLADGAVNDSDGFAWTGEEADRLLGDPPDWGFYSKHFLGIDEEAADETPARYVYPFARLVDDQVTVFRQALTEIAEAAAEAGDAEIAAVASGDEPADPDDADDDGDGDSGDDGGPAATDGDGDGGGDDGGDGDGGKIPPPSRDAVVDAVRSVDGDDDGPEAPLLVRSVQGDKAYELRAGDVVYRDYTIRRRDIDEDARTVPLTFSSEEPVDRGWCMEILDHGPKSVRMHRMLNRAAVLVGHDPDKHPGVIEEAEISAADRLGRCLARFGRSAYAEEIFQDLIDRIRCHVSVGYRVYAVEERELPGGGLEIRVVDWEPYEVSIVSIPADANKKVGVNRSFGRRYALESTTTRTKEGVMPEAVIDREEVKRAERARAKEIREFGAELGLEDLAQRHIDEGTEFSEFRLLALTEVGRARKVTHDQMREETKIGMSGAEVQRYSLHNALRAHLDKDWSKAGLEREAHEAMEAKAERAANGFYVPYDVLTQAYSSPERGRRDLNIADGSAQDGAGAALVGTQHLAGSMIDMLRPASVLANLGVRVLDGLTGNIEIPRRDTGATFYVIDNETTGVTESTPTFGTVAASPKTIAARVDITRAMLQQSSPAAEGLTRDDLVIGMGVKMDALGLKGSGTLPEPRGLVNLTGAGLVVGGANGAAPDFADVVQLETECALDNALVANSAYCFSPKVRGFLKTTEKATGTAAFIMGEGNELNGYRVAHTTQMPDDLDKGTAVGVCSALLFGNFTDAIFFLWGGLDLKADETTLGDKGGLVLRVFQDFWFNVRHPESFSVMKDALC